MKVEQEYFDRLKDLIEKLEAETEIYNDEVVRLNHVLVELPDDLNALRSDVNNILGDISQLADEVIRENPEASEEEIGAWDALIGLKTVPEAELESIDEIYMNRHREWAPLFQIVTSPPTKD